MFQPFKLVGPEPPAGSDIWYRAEDRRYANYDPFAEFEQSSGSHLAIEVTRYALVKTTPKGVWVRNWLGGKTFVLGKAAKQYAVPTLELALRDLKARKEVHAGMAQARADQAKQHLEATKRCLDWLEAQPAVAAE